MSAYVGKKVIIPMHPVYQYDEFVITGHHSLNGTIWLDVENYDDDILRLSVKLEDVKFI